MLVNVPKMPNPTCEHFTTIPEGVVPTTPGACQECQISGDSWVQLRMCLICGHVGCCDSSKNAHATKHFHETNHPIMQSAEPGQDWMWCYVDELMVRP